MHTEAALAYQCNNILNRLMRRRPENEEQEKEEDEVDEDSYNETR